MKINTRWGKINVIERIAGAMQGTDHILPFALCHLVTPEERRLDPYMLLAKKVIACYKESCREHHNDHTRRLEFETIMKRELFSKVYSDTNVFRKHPEKITQVIDGLYMVLLNIYN